MIPMKKIIIVLAVIISFTSLVNGQYFGQNKPRYREFDFKVKETPHFDLHYYGKNEDVITSFSQMMELWYALHSTVLNHEIPFKNPFILYNNHAEFQQTNAISGSIGVGTGGVTEGLKNRVVMPLTFSNQQTNQVLGHELVHAFQFNMILGGDSTDIQSLSNLPLWTIEGMAEYMSIGRIDPFTAMWMRNAILNDDVPSLQKMANPKYFPYRYGQAAWSFITGFFGDDQIEPFFMNTAKYGMEYASQASFGLPLKVLNEQWENSLKTYYEPYLKDKKESRIGKTLLSKKNSGSLNVSPAISPNGRYVVFMSERDLFSTDIFLADARNGEILKKLSSLIKDRDLDNYNFLESAGTWSPDSKQFAFVGFSKGKNVLIIKDVESGKTTSSHSIPKLAAFTNPTWSPDGKEIVLTGSTEGQTDLYAYTLKGKKLRQLTDDPYSEVQANFNADGSQLVFSYDKRSFVDGRTNGNWTYDLAIMDYASGSITILDVFHGANNLNPTYDHEDNIYFLSERDGYRNMYRYMASDGQVLMMTDFLTGLSGISRYSPVLTAARSRDRVLFTHYYGNEYIIREASSDELLNESVDPKKIDFSAGTLPAIGMNTTDIVNKKFNEIDDFTLTSEENFKNKKYDAKFKLDAVGGGAGIGVSNGSNFGLNNGVQAAGAIQLLFSDLLGNHQLIGQAALNGTVNDFGGQLFYINRKSQLAWGGGISHTPQAFAIGRNIYLDQIQDSNGNTFDVGVDELSVLRIFNQTATGFVQLPFSPSLRIEAGSSIGNQSFRIDAQRNFFDPITGFFLGQEREKQETGDQIVFNQFYTIQKGLEGQAYVAFVGDKSHFGLTSPLYGERFRLSAEKSFGINNFYAINADYRRYFWTKPVSLAFRMQGYKRFEQEVNALLPVYIGQMGLVRGYDFIFDANGPEEFGDVSFNQLLGSSFGIMSFEVRLPFTGPKQLALIGSKVFFTDLALFFDAGMAFNAFGDIGAEGPNAPELAMSVGTSLRFNLFGAMILEPYWAYPLQTNSRVVFGLNFIPGW